MNLKLRQEGIEDGLNQKIDRNIVFIAALAAVAGI
tara:strand:+ start:814 stop:918 length:105 start_codon:yes stop_codon:yes gene_type:complete